MTGVQTCALPISDALLTRRDCVIVASVSCIYGLGSPSDYYDLSVTVKRGERRLQDKFLRQMMDIQYSRNDIDFARGTFRVRGDVVDVFPASGETAYRVEFFGDEVDRITHIDPLTGEIIDEPEQFTLFPSSHYATPKQKIQAAIEGIRREYEERVAWFEANNKLLEAQRLTQRTKYDLEMLEQTGFVKGIENYSRYLTNREPGEQPATLLDYFPDDFLMLIDESHVTVPQVRAMYNGDRARKEVLVQYGFRLPSALDNRPLRFDEFERHVNQVIYVSATPGDYELERSPAPAEQVIRPTGLLDPEISVRPTDGQVDALIAEIRERIGKKQRVLVTTLTKRMAEDLSSYLTDMGVKTAYIHSEIDTLERGDILRDLRMGVYDVLVGINLLREGIDLPEVSLVAIMDADKEGFLRSERSLIQTIGRAARHVDGTVIMYGDTITDSMRRAIDETKRRRAIQQAYNQKHGITPQGITKEKFPENHARYRVDHLRLKLIDFGSAACSSYRLALIANNTAYGEDHIFLLPEIAAIETIHGNPNHKDKESVDVRARLIHPAVQGRIHSIESTVNAAPSGEIRDIVLAYELAKLYQPPIDFSELKGRSCEIRGIFWRQIGGQWQGRPGESNFASFVSLDALPLNGKYCLAMRFDIDTRLCGFADETDHLTSNPGETLHEEVLVLPKPSELKKLAVFDAE